MFNVFFMKSLAENMKQEGVTVDAVNPGLCSSNVSSLLCLPLPLPRHLISSTLHPLPMSHCSTDLRSEHTI